MLSPIPVLIPPRLLALMPCPVQVTQRAIIAHLASGEDLDLSDLIRSLAWKALRGKIKYPRKSIAAGLRERGTELTVDEREAIVDLAVEVLRAATSDRPLDEEWGTVADAALALDVPVEHVRSLLAREEGRRELGWPWRVDGQEWRIPMAALRGETRARYLADLPMSDPYGYGSEACDSRGPAGLDSQ